MSASPATSEEGDLSPRISTMQTQDVELAQKEGKFADEQTVGKSKSEKLSSNYSVRDIIESFGPDDSFLSDSNSNAPKKEKEKNNFTFRVFRFGTGLDLVLIIVGIICAFCAGMIMPIFMLSFGDLVNSVGASESSRDFRYYAKVQAVLGSISFVLSATSTSCLELAAERQIRAIREAYMTAVMRQEMGWFDTFDAGVLASKLNQNCAFIREALGIKLGQLFMFMAMFIGGYAVGFIRNWEMTLVLSVTLPFIAAGGAFMMKNLSAAATKSEKAYSYAGSIAEESFGSIRTVQAFGSEPKMLARYAKRLQRAYNAGKKGGWNSGIGLGMTLGIMFLSYALGFWFGGTQVAKSEDANLCCSCLVDPTYSTCPSLMLAQDCLKVDCFSGGEALTCFFAVLIAAFALGQASPSVTAFFKASTATISLFELIERVPSIDPYDQSGQKPTDVKGHVAFKDVVFSYPSRKEKFVFNGLSLEIEAGRTVALVGGSGCGKSTIIQLVERFYDADDGEVLLDGIPVKDYNVQHLRSYIAIVSQEPRLFAKSIKENIRDGRLDATDEEIKQAAQDANAWGFISQFPKQLDTHVGEAGSQLSGGQKQRIAIARAILRKPRILILDEATSALDNESEKIVQRTLDSLIQSSKRTTIVIAHRLSTVKNCDKIVVLDNSDGLGAKVVEQGSHRDLMKKPEGLYRALVMAQSLGSSTGEEDLAESDEALVIAARDSSLMAAAALAGEMGEGQSGLGKRLSQLSSLVRKYSTDVSPVADEPKKKGLFKKKAKVEGPPPPKYFTVLKLLAPHKGTLVGACFGAVCNGLTFPLFAVVFSFFLAVFFDPNPDVVREKCSTYVWGFVGLAVLVFVGATLQNGLFEIAGQRLIRTLRTETFEAILYQDMSFFDDPMYSTGTLSQALSNDIILVNGWVNTNLGVMVQNAVALTAGLVISFTASWRLALVTLAGFCVMAPANAVEMMVLSGPGAEDISSPETPGFVMNETITNIKTVHSYCLYDSVDVQYHQTLKANFKKGSRDAVLLGFFWGFAQFIQFAAQTLSLWYGGILMERAAETGDDSIDLTRMMMAIMALLMAAFGLGQSTVFATDAKKAKAAAGRVWAIKDRVPLIDSRSSIGSTPTIAGDIKFENVNFVYPQRKNVQVYKDLSFTVKPGQTVALVGSSGCGKSTVIQLLERFYDIVPSEGEEKPGKLELDDIDIKSINVAHLRRQLGLVSQEPILFNTTIGENILYGRPEASMNDVISAAKMANAHKFIQSFPDGYKTNVGNFGGQLSGGQKQRIAIARAILRNPKLLLLDEATSALDSESEKVVQEALDELMQASNRTTIVVAHRLSTIKNADNIVVFFNKNNQGSRIVEVGTHDELLKIKGGVYAGLVRIAQMGEAAHGV